MEGGDAKALARAKRASSRRGRARHSTRKHAPSAANPIAAVAAVEEALPSNWERYSDGGGSGDEGAAAPVDGQVVPKSKGADYFELLSSDAPQLYEDLPELGGLSSMMLEPGLGYFDGDSWLEPPSASEQQTAHVAAALLTVDLRILGRSIAQLHVAERLMLEPELFPDQVENFTSEIGLLDFHLDAMLQCAMYKVKQEDHPAKLFEAGTDDRLQDENCVDTAKTDTGAASMYGNDQHTTSSLRNNGVMDSWNQSGFASDASRIRLQSTLTEITDTVSVLKGGSLLPRRDTVEQRSKVNDRNKTETSAQPPGFPKFVPAAAEADLDDLLDMLDNQAAQPPSDISDLRNGTEIASSPTLSFLSSKASPQFPQVDPHKGLNRIPTVSSGNDYMPSTVAITDRSEATPKEVKSSSSLSLDDDLDSWLDSI